MFDSVQCFQYIESVAHKVAQNFACKEIRTPIFEHAEVFQKNLGDHTDIVGKEVYIFEDRGGEKLVLRPEGTAGVARSFLMNSWHRETPLKLYYNGPMFRYERPQKGRQRQFHQVGFEFFGLSSPQGEFEAITSALSFLQNLNLPSLQLEINSLGDLKARAGFKEALVAHLAPLKEGLSPDSQNRLSTNPLRVLDSKDLRDQEALKAAPLLADFLSAESTENFERLCGLLKELKIPHRVNPLLVRGLDYYNDCVFEFTSTDLGAQATVLAGGRYDALIPSMGGSDTPSIGWAAGIERIALLLPPPPSPQVQVAVLLMSQDSATENLLYKTLQYLRANHISTEAITTGNFSKKFKKAQKLQAQNTIVLGEENIKNPNLTLKTLKTGEEISGSLEELTKALKKSCRS